MERSVSDELELPGHAVLYKSMTVAEAIARVRELLASWESKGWTKLSDVQTQDELHEFETLMDALSNKAERDDLFKAIQEGNQ